ncbi:uncharacterized protein [Primulina eburnea]|uniref:uncharacterized protein isoform X1 n=2 Tax=Primulina eburnea TaxID=1245227 RepID=UPI003C6C22AB
MAFGEEIGGLSDDERKAKLILSLLRKYVPDVKHPFLDPSDLSYVVTTVKTHKLLLERGLAKQEVMDCWKKAVDSWDHRVRSLLAGDMPTDKCWAGISLLAVTCQECSSQRFLASNSSWCAELLNHIQLPAASPLVKVAAFAALSDLFTRLSRFPEAKKDGASLASKVIEPTLKMLNTDSSGAEELLGLLCALMNFFPVSIHRHYDNVEAAIVSKIMSGECSASVLKKLSCGLSLLPKSRGDKDSWCLMMTKILLSIESHLNDAFQGLEEDSRSSEAMKVLLLSGKKSPPPLGGLVVSEQTSNLSTRRLEQLLGSKICALMSSCSTMLKNFYPVQVPVPIRALVTLAWRVLLVDGSLSQSPFPFGTTLKQEFICSELPLLQLHMLEIITAVINGLRSKVLPHAADILRLLMEYMRRCIFAELRVRAYSIMKVLILIGGFGTAIHVIPDVINIVFIDLDPLAYKDGTSSKAASEVVKKSGQKRKKHSSTTGSFQEQPVKDVEVEMPQTLFPTSVKIAALEVLESILIVGGYSKFDPWRPKVNHLLITIAANACKGGWSKEERNVFISAEPSLVWADFQLASLRGLYASLISPGCSSPSHLASGLELFRAGTEERGTKLADYCDRALHRLISPRTDPMLGTSLSDSDYKGQGHKFPDTSYATGHSLLSTFEVGIQGIDPAEPESEDDDLYENWVGNDNDVMEMQLTETQKNANDATEPLVTTVPSVSVFSEEKYLVVPAGNPAEKMVIGGNDFTVESPISETTKKQRRDSAPTTSSNLPTDAQSDVVTSERAAFKPFGQETTVKSNFDNGISAKDEMNASMSEQLVLETKNDDVSPIVERLSAFLSRSEKRRGKTLESDNESADSIPDIVDGDPDSD